MDMPGLSCKMALVGWLVGWECHFSPLCKWGAKIVLSPFLTMKLFSVRTGNQQTRAVTIESMLMSGCG